MKQLLHTFRGGVTELQSAGVGPVVCLFGAGSAMELDSPTLTLTRKIHVDATASLYAARAGANTLSGSVTGQLHYTTTDPADTAGNSLVTFATGQANQTKVDDSNTDDISANAFWSNIFTAEAGTGSISWISTSFAFEADTNAVSLLSSWGAGSGRFDADETVFDPIHGGRFQVTVEAWTQFLIPSAGTWENLGVQVANNNINAGATVDIVSRVNSADGNQTLGFDSTTTQDLAVYDESNTDTLAQGDLLSFEWTMAGWTSGAFNHEGLLTQFTNTSGETLSANAGPTYVINDDTTEYAALGGSFASSATESDVQHPARFASTGSKLAVRIGRYSTGAETLTATIRMDGVDGNQTLSFTDLTTTDALIDESNTDNIAADTELSLELASPVGGSSYRPNSVVMVMTAAAESTATVPYPTQRRRFAPLLAR